MELVHEFTYRVELGETYVPGAGPWGTRMVASVTGGEVWGERINGTVVGPGADWVVVGPDGFGRVDVRAQVLTTDGATIYVSYIGVLEMNEAVMGAIGTADTAFEDQYLRVCPVLETGDPRYAWVNTTVFVGRGRITRTGVEYEVFRVT